MNELNVNDIALLADENTIHYDYHNGLYLFSHTNTLKILDILNKRKIPILGLDVFIFDSKYINTDIIADFSKNTTQS